MGGCHERRELGAGDVWYRGVRNAYVAEQVGEARIDAVAGPGEQGLGFDVVEIVRFIHLIRVNVVGAHRGARSCEETVRRSAFRPRRCNALTAS